MRGSVREGVDSLLEQSFGASRLVAGLLSPADNKARLDFLSSQLREGALLMSRWGVGDADWWSIRGIRVAGWRAPDVGLYGTLA